MKLPFFERSRDLTRTCSYSTTTIECKFTSRSDILLHSAIPRGTSDGINAVPSPSVSLPRRTCCRTTDQEKRRRRSKVLRIDFARRGIHGSLQAAFISKLRRNRPNGTDGLTAPL